MINQTYDNIELIVIDDGSSDESPRIIETMGQKHGFKYIFKENEGVCATLNRAIFQESTGTYISICASDDFYSDDKITKQVSYLESEKQFDFVYSRSHIVDENDEIVRTPYYRAYKPDVKFSDVFLGKIHILPTTVLYKREFFDKVGHLPEDIINEDGYLWLKSLSLGLRLGFLDEYLTYYRRHESNTTRQTLLIHQASRSLFETYKDHPLYEKAIDQQAVYWFSSLSRNHKKQALHWLPRAAKKFYSKFFIWGILQLILPPKRFTPNRPKA